jgi:hypothetical protein
MRQLHGLHLSVVGGLFFAIGFTRVAQAASGDSLISPMPINILETQYTTTVSVWSYSKIPPDDRGITNSRTMVSPVPISDSMYSSRGWLEAEANAGLFDVSAIADADDRYDITLEAHAGAEALAEIWFSPLASETTPINIQFSGGSYVFYTDGQISLLDVTSGDELWKLWWNGGGLHNGNVPWELTDVGSSATVTLDTAFNAAHTYRLSMGTGGGSALIDFEYSSIQLFGLEPIPEPSAFALTGLGGALLLLPRGAQAVRRLRSRKQVS